MKKKQLHIKLSTVILLVVLFALLTSFAVGKYTTTIRDSGAVSFTARLATDVDIVNDQEYKVIPGYDITQEIFVNITGKTEIPAYLYIQVVDSLNADEIAYQINDPEWKKLSDAEANEIQTENDGPIYVYTEATGTLFRLTGNSNPSEMKTISMDVTIEVSQNIKGVNLTDKQLLFHAYLIEATD